MNSQSGASRDALPSYAEEMLEAASSHHVEVRVTLDVDIAGPVDVQAEALQAVPPRSPRVWSYMAALHHLLLWPLVRALRHSRVIDLHGATITDVQPIEQPAPSDAAARR